MALARQPMINSLPAGKGDWASSIDIGGQPWQDWPRGSASAIAGKFVKRKTGLNYSEREKKLAVSTDLDKLHRAELACI